MTKYKYFDTCVRIGNLRAPNAINGDTSLSALLEDMKKYNIKKAVVDHAVSLEASPILGLQMLMDEIKEHDNLYSAWSLMPFISKRIDDTLLTTELIEKNKIVLSRVPVQDFCYGKGDTACFAPNLDVCSEMNLPVFLDFRNSGADALLRFDFEICKRYPKIPFVIEGAGGYPFHKIFWALREYENCYLSTLNYGVQNGVQFISDELGPEKIIFSSNWPNDLIGRGLSKILFAGVSDENREKMAYGNFEKLLERIGK